MTPEFKSGRFLRKIRGLIEQGINIQTELNSVKCEPSDRIVIKSLLDQLRDSTRGSLLSSQFPDTKHIKWKLTLHLFDSI